MSPQFVRYSKFLSLILRHKPEKIGLHLDAQGWANVEELLAKAKVHGVVLTRPQLEQIIATNDKQRFAFSPDGQRIRASQGHSIQVDLGLEPQTPHPTCITVRPLVFLSPFASKGCWLAAAITFISPPTKRRPFGWASGMVSPSL